MAGSGTNQTIGQQVSQQTLPQWENAGYQNIASQAFGQAFDPNTGLPNGAPANQTVAGQTGNFSNYLNQANGAATMGSGLKNNLEGYSPNVSFDPTSTGIWNSQTANQYMNPYTDSVLQAQQKLANDQYGQQRSALDQQAAASGALGGDRNAVAQTGLTNDFNLQQENLQANALQNSYQNAQNAFNNDQNRQLQSDVTNSQLGLAAGIQNAELNYGARAASNQFELGQGGLNLNGLNQAGSAAQLAQGYAQSQNDTAYQNSMMNYLFPQQQIGWAQGILNGTPQQLTTQSDIYFPQGNPFSQALGAQQTANSGKAGGSGGGSANKPASTPIPGSPGSTGAKTGGNTEHPVGNNDPGLVVNQNAGIYYNNGNYVDRNGNVIANASQLPSELQQLAGGADGDPSGLQGDALGSAFENLFGPQGSNNDISNPDLQGAIDQMSNNNVYDTGQVFPWQNFGSQYTDPYYAWAGMNQGSGVDTSTDPSTIAGYAYGTDPYTSIFGYNSGGPVQPPYELAQQAYSGFGSQLTPDEWDAYGGSLSNPAFGV